MLIQLRARALWPRLVLFSALIFGLSMAHAANREIELATASFPPFRSVSSDGVSGADYEIVTEVLQRMGYQPSVKVYPLNRALKVAEAGREVAGFFTFTRNPEREKHFIFSAPISTVTDVLFKGATRKLHWQQLSDLSAYTISVSEGYNYAPSFMAAMHKQQLKTISVASDTPEHEHLRRLKRGVVDLAICEVSVCSALQAQYPSELAGLDYINRPVGETRTFHLGISRLYPGAEALIRDFDRELEKFAAEGKRKKIFRRYGMSVMLD